MSKNRAKIISRIYDIILSASIIIAGSCLIAGCLFIYYSGDGYSRQLVNETFSKICIPVYICLALVIGSFVVNAIIPQNRKTKVSKHYSQMLLSLLNVRNTDNCDEFKNIEKTKKTLKAVNIIVFTISSIIFLSYALNSSNFHQSDINGSMIKAMCVLLPCLAVSFFVAVLTHYLNIRFTKKQIDILKTLPQKDVQKTTSQADKNQKTVMIIKFAILAVGVAVLVFGAISGGFADVLTKAINICTECIGLG